MDLRSRPLPTLPRPVAQPTSPGLAGIASRNRLLGLLPQADFSLLAPHFKEITLERGALLHEAGEPIAEVCFLHSGMISLLTVMESGDGIEVAMIGREGAVGLSTGLGARIAVSRAVVQLPGAAVQVPAARFAAVAAQSEALRQLIVCQDLALLAQVQQSVACNVLHSVEQRLCRWLMQARDRVGSDQLPLTHEFLSQMLGVRRSTISLMVGVLQGAGMIHCRRGTITIRDPAGVEATACECYGLIRKHAQCVPLECLAGARGGEPPGGVRQG